MALALVGTGGFKRAEGNGRVQLRSNHLGVFAALTLGLGLFGCANPEVFDSNEHWFSRPFDWSGRTGGYTFSELQEAHNGRGSSNTNDLVAANGACPPAPGAAAPAPAPVGAPGANPAAADAPSLLGGGIALGMTECDVVYRAGAPSSVQLGNNPNGDRTAVLTFGSGPRAGIYRFERGRLTDMDRVDAPAPAPAAKVAKRAVKKTTTANPEQVSTE
jgi:hypothetical protein